MGVTGIPLELKRCAFIFRIWLRSGEIEKVASLAGFRTAVWWLGTAPDDSPLILRETGSQEIYSLHCRLP